VQQQTARLLAASSMPEHVDNKILDQEKAKTFTATRSLFCIDDFYCKLLTQALPFMVSAEPCFPELRKKQKKQKKTPKNTKKTLLTTKEDPLKSNARLCRALLAGKIK
jgi:hypothetical protein